MVAESSNQFSWLSCLSRALFIALSFVVGCSLVVDTSELSRCGAGRKLCDGSCVLTNDPAFGCDPNSCEPCRKFNAVPVCDGDQCVRGACLDGFGCDQCQANLWVDPLNCGSCGTSCKPNEFCKAGDCTPTP